MREVSAVIRPGDFVAMVGPNGSDKSTLAQLIAGLLGPTEGQVLIGGQALKSVPRADRHHGPHDLAAGD